VPDGHAEAVADLDRFHPCPQLVPDQGGIEQIAQRGHHVTSRHHRLG
jgi:hypothetical protein